jgi:Zn-dependent protease with chaperone function
MTFSFRTLRNIRPARVGILARLARSGTIAVGLGAGASTVAVVCAAIWQTQPIGDYTGVSGPVTASVDVISGLRYCSAIGAVGLIDDDGLLYFDDWCTATTYKYDLDQSPAKEVVSSSDGLTGGLALDSGTFYGIAGPGQFLVAPGVYSFNPGTLALRRLVAKDQCPGPYGLTGLAADPATGDLFVTSWCGLWRVSDLYSTSPVMRRIAAGAFDGIAVADGGNAVWVAGINRNDLIELSSAGAVITSIDVPDGPVGVALISPSLRSPVAGDLFASDNDGSLSMVDTHDGDKVSVVATAGNRDEYLTVGPDGYLYVAKADRIEQVQPAIFGKVTIPSRAGQGALSAVALSAAAHASAFDAGLPLIVTIAVIAAVLILLAALAGVNSYRRRGERPAVPGTVAPPTSAAPLAPTALTINGVDQDLADPDLARRRRLTDPDILPSGTTLRLVVLLLMIIASTGSVYAHLNVIARPAAEAAARSCLSAVSVPAVANGTAPPGSALEVLACVHPYALPMAIWSLSGIAAVLAGTTLLYALTPWWMKRFTKPWLPWRGSPWWAPGPPQRLLDLSSYGELGKVVRSAIAELACEVGLTRSQMPTLLVNRYAGHTTDAQAFGHRRHGYIRLNRGLLEMYRGNRRGFDAVMLHELAHLRHRDNLPTYLTYAAWRAFVVLVLLPYAVSLAAPTVIGDPLDWRAYRFTVTAPDPRITAAILVLAALVFLTSRAVFRVRETYADATATLHDDGGLDELLAEREQKDEGKRRIPHWLSHHPSYKRRRSDLKYSETLADADGIAMFAAGVAISLLAVNTWFVVTVGSMATWLPLGRLLTIARDIDAGDRGVAIWFTLASYGPATLIALASIVGLACTVTWRAELSALPDHARGVVPHAAWPLVAGLLIGGPLSAIYADAGTWGVFDISVPWDLADVAASTAALSLVVFIVFWWAQESVAILIPVTRTSLRRARATAIIAGMTGAAPALFTWMLAHDNVTITSFFNATVPGLVSGWFGAHWAYIDYYPLTYLLLLPGTALLVAVPALRLVVGTAGRVTRPQIRTGLVAGVGVAMTAELACFLLAISARHILGGSLGAAFENGSTGSTYLPLSWMMWTGATACAITSAVIFRKADRFALSGVLLTSFVGSSISAVLLLVPLFFTYCGARGFWCATVTPHDLLDFYGTMASEMPVFAVVLALFLLALTRPRGYTRSAAPEPVTEPVDTPRWTYWHVILWLVVLLALAGVYMEITQVLNFY